MLFRLVKDTVYLCSKINYLIFYGLTIKFKQITTKFSSGENLPIFKISTRLASSLVRAPNSSLGAHQYNLLTYCWVAVYSHIMLFYFMFTLSCRQADIVSSPVSLTTAKFQNDPNGKNSGARWKRIYEKNLKSKFSYQTPFKKQYDCRLFLHTS